MRMSAKQIERIRRSNHARNTGSYDTPDEEGNIRSPTVKRILPQQYLHEYVLSALEADPISSLIYENDMELNGRQTLSTNELAAKLRITPGAISQRRKRIMEIVNKAEGAIYG